MFRRSYPNMPELVTAPIGPPFLPPAFFSSSVPPLVAHPPTLQEQRAASSCSSLPVTRTADLRGSSAPASFLGVLLFHVLPRPPSPSWFFDEGLCSHCRSTGSSAGLATVSSSSVVLRSHSGCRGLVIFQAWSV